MKHLSMAAVGMKSFLKRCNYFGRRFLIMVLVIVVPVYFFIFFALRTVSLQQSFLNDVVPLRLNLYGNPVLEVDDISNEYLEEYSSYKKVQLSNLSPKEKLPKSEAIQKFYSAHYKQNTIKPRKSLLLYVGIFSAFQFIKRRKAIRTTWLRECTIERLVVCKFFMDSLDHLGKPIPKREMDNLTKEATANMDLEIVDSPRGWNFALRFLIVIERAMKVAEFEFFLRIDDDHFPCMDRLIRELPYRPKRGLYWGWLHCNPGMYLKKKVWGRPKIRNGNFNHLLPPPLYVTKRNKSVLPHPLCYVTNHILSLPPRDLASPS